MVKAFPDVGRSFGPDALPAAKAGIELATLADALSHRAGGEVQNLGSSLDFGLELFGECLHALHDSVIFHTRQAETSHSLSSGRRNKSLAMNVDETFRRTLMAMRAARGLTAAELSRRAGLNIRAVKDIEEGRAQSPKISTVFALAGALGVDPGEMLGLGPRLTLQAELAQFLQQYDQEQQERLLTALRALPLAPAG